MVYSRERMHLYVQGVCVCMQDLLNLGVHVACVTREQEQGSKEHMFGVLLRPVL